MGERHQLHQGRHPARVQLFQAGRMTQLGRPVQRKYQLGVHGLLGPQCAVIIEHRDAVPLGDEVRRIRIGHGGDKVHDRLPSGRLAPARQLVRAHAGLLRLMFISAPISSPTKT